MPSRWGCVAAGFAIGLSSFGCKGERSEQQGEPQDASTRVADGEAPGSDAAGVLDAAGVVVPPDPALDDAGYSLDASSCIPGIPRCHGDFGYQECQQDGTWGPPHSCAGYSSNGTSSYCVMTVGSSHSEPWAACVDPACWYWITRGFVPGPTPVGICTSSTTIRQCNGGGTLSTETCDGVCTEVGVIDGRRLGYCSVQCIEGARECLGGSAYRECQAGRWLSELRVCEAGELCNPLGTGSTPDIRCGGVCDSGTSRCASDGLGIEVCNDAGSWEAGQACLLGTCHPAGPQAQCQADCSPDQFQCAEDGATAQQSCGERQQWTEPMACLTETSCRISAGQSLGCIECIGPLSAGNEYGVSDSRCEAGGVAQCGEDNTWQPPTLCAASETCVELSSGASHVAYCQP